MEQCSCRFHQPGLPRTGLGAVHLVAWLLPSTLSTWAGAASLTWDWSISLVESNRPGAVWGGTFITGDAPDSDGFYTITALTGERQGVAILRLQPAGTAIPDNAPYAVDNRVRPAHPEGQLTKAGFGFELANGWFENPFLATWELPELVYLAFLSKPPFGTGAPDTEEPQVAFQASIRVPEPLTAALLLSGLLAIGAVRSMNLKNVESGCMGEPISAEC